MIRKISYIVFSAAILVSGYVAVKKLNYWERSIWIFKTSSSDLRFEGGRGFGTREGDRGRMNSGRGGSGRPADFRMQPGTRGMREIPDSMRIRFEQQRRQGDMRMGRMQPGGDRERFEGPGREGSHNGKRIRLQTVGWFLAVFASFTVLTIYADRAFGFVRRKRPVWWLAKAKRNC